MSALSDGRILLRKYCMDDVDPLYEAVRSSLQELIPWMPWCHSGYGIDESRAWIELNTELWMTGTEHNFGVFSAADKSFLGSCGINRIDQSYGTANLGYWIKSAACGQGIATAASMLVAEFGFESLGLNRIEIIAAVENIPSLRVAEKTGAHREGLLRNRLSMRGVHHDAVLFSLLPEDIRRD